MMSEHSAEIVVRNARDRALVAYGRKLERERVLHTLLHSIPVTYDGYASIEELEAAISVTAPAAHEVWDGSVAPGGYVCSKCGWPTESEPCEHLATSPTPPGSTGETGGQR